MWFMAVHQSGRFPASQARLVSGLVTAVVVLTSAALLAVAIDDPASVVLVLGIAFSCWLLVVFRDRISGSA